MESAGGVAAAFLSGLAFVRLYQIGWVFIPQPLNPLVMLFASNPPVKSHHGVFLAQPPSGATPVGFHSYNTLIAASGSSAFNCRISEHKGDVGFLHGASNRNVFAVVLKMV